MGIGSMCAVMLTLTLTSTLLATHLLGDGLATLPLTSTLLATLLLANDGRATMPLVIVAVVVAYVLTARFTTPADAPATTPVGPPQPSNSTSSRPLTRGAPTGPG